MFIKEFPDMSKYLTSDTYRESVRTGPGHETLMSVNYSHIVPTLQF